MYPASYFQGRDPIVEKTYDRLLSALKKSTPTFKLEYKNTSVHVVAGSAFLGIHFMKSQLKLNIVLDQQMKSARVHTIEKVSANRFHNEVRLSDPVEVNAELLKWIKQAYLLKASRAKG